ncbi:hypothetical protein ACFYXF_03710 [Streptomyces sp. NPDC002680]|uniref:aromatic-ring hydroxylase C-terminal domain-containing protein n=1 Tax=Streptomyces sp. NPDC002680 TaxID=3364659 RepID=UPI003690683E
MDVRYDLGDDHRLVGTLCPDMKLTLERPDPDVVTAVTGSADLLPEGRGLLLGLVDRAEVRDAAAAWTGRVDTVTARGSPARRGDGSAWGSLSPRRHLYKTESRWPRHRPVHGQL